MTPAFAAEPAGRVRASVVHIRVGETSGGAGVVWPGGIVITNAHVATERRVTLILPDGSEQALAGCAVLRFDEQGLVVEARDYWHLEPGRREPHETWGR